MGFALRLAVVAVVLAAAVYWPRLFDKTYKVHTAGNVLVTGTSSGIGRDAAIAIANKGFTVYATVRKQKDVDALNKLKVKNLKPIIMDVTNEEQIAAAYQTISASGAPLVALVNNAGISTRSPLEATPMKLVRMVYEVNVFGLTQVTQAFLPLLRASQGRIVNVGSVAGLIAADSSTTYSGTKFAVEAISDSLRRELAPFGVSVSVVEPAYVDTNIAKKTIEDEQSPERFATEENKKVYRGFYSTYAERRTRAFKHSDTTEVTDVAIVDAITSPKPRSRYVVANVHGMPAWVVAKLFWLLPDRVADAFMSQQDTVFKATEPKK